MASENPFVDPNPSFDENVRDHSFAIDSTLAVGRNASLTLGTDSLIVLGEYLQSLIDGAEWRLTDATDEALEKSDSSNCCGLLPSGEFHCSLSSVAPLLI